MEVVALFYNAVRNLEINDVNFSALATITFRSFVSLVFKSF